MYQGTSNSTASTVPIDRPRSRWLRHGGATASSHRRLLITGFTVAVVVVLVVAVYVTLLGTLSLGSLTEAPNHLSDSGQVAPDNTRPGCQTGNLTPTALLIPNSNPSISVTVGDHVDVTLEFNVSFTTVPVAGLKVYTPTIFVTLPTVGGTAFPVTFNNYTFTMTNSQWTSLSYNKLVTSAFTFNPATNAILTTQKLATMADTPSGSLKLEWRWSWMITSPNGSNVQGPWTIPTS